MGDEEIDQQAIVLLAYLTYVSIADPPDATAKMRGGNRAQAPVRRETMQNRSAQRAMIARVPSATTAARTFSYEPSPTAMAAPQVIRRFPAESNEMHGAFRQSASATERSSASAPRGAGSKMSGKY